MFPDRRPWVPGPAYGSAALFLALCALLPPPATAASLEKSAELYFELKLLVRPGGWFRSGAVDDWAGGKLQLARRPAAEGSRFELIRPLEDPWTFRWFPAKQEVKLGAAVAVDEPVGDPYASLAPALAARAGRLHDAWWGRDRVQRTAPLEPEWADRTERFWADRHRAEDRDPLPEHPVYPFHVLGDPTGRFAFDVRPDGALAESSVVERMTSPWLADGWSEWTAGRKRSGYGFWESRSAPPDWEPRTYPAFAAALKLLAWPLPRDDRPVTAPELVTSALEVVAQLLPRSRGRLPFDLPVELHRSLNRTRNDLRETVVEGSIRTSGERSPVRVRVWRYTALPTAPSEIDPAPVQDELQLLLERPGSSPVRLWIRIGYRPFPPSTEPSGG